MDPDRDLRRSAALVIAGFGPVVVAGLLVPLRDHMINANVALVLTLVVVAAAAVGGGQAGAVAGIVSALAYDFFFTEPYLRLTIDSQDDLETTLLLLVVGIAVGSLASKLHRADDAVARGRSELDHIRHLSDVVARDATREELLETAEQELRSLLHLEDCRFQVEPPATSLPRIERTGVLSERPRVLHFRERGIAFPESGVELPVSSRGNVIGRFLLTPDPSQGVTLEECVVAVALADQVGAALRDVSPTE